MDLSLHPVQADALPLSQQPVPLYIYNELTPPEILRLVGGDFPGKSPNMRLVVVEQLHKT